MSLGETRKATLKVDVAIASDGDLHCFSIMEDVFYLEGMPNANDKVIDGVASKLVQEVMNGFDKRIHSLTFTTHVSNKYE